MCGDGIVDRGEACDDGNEADDDECIACSPAQCGDGFVLAGVEECDDGNVLDGDGCTAVCTLPTCDDGLLGGEETDIDCGGGECPKCPVDAGCAAASDCQSGLCADGACVNAASCQAVLDADPNAPSGVYTIDPDGDGAGTPFQAYCDQETDGGGWTMVLKISSGVMGDPHALWSGGAVNADDESLLNLEKSEAHYVSSFIDDYWNANGVAITEARTHVYTGDAIAKFWKYDAAMSSTDDWYSNDTLVDSSYEDLPAEVSNHFSILGENTSGRRFFINRNYAGCPGDQGWLNIDTTPDNCMWDMNKGAEPIRILYAPETTFINWTDAVNDGSIGDGDVFTVFVR